MKRLLWIVPAALLAIPLAGAHAAGSSSESGDATTRAVCHRTTSASGPYVKLRVTARQYRAHLRHAADIVPAPRGACPRTVLSATRGGTAFNIALTGEAEQPGGDPVGTGTATVRLRRNQGQVCFTLRAQNITLPAAGAHIHVGGAGASGGIVVQLRAPGAGGAASGCSAAPRATVNAILRNPAGYYVNVHTTDYPGGAVRGQLRGTSTDEFGRIHSVAMTGANERPPAAGDPDGTGTAVLRIRRDDGLVCYRLTVQNIQLPSVGAHIHRGPATGSGPIVVNFEAPGASGVSTGCTQASDAIIGEILANPSNFYVNVHTRDHPAGAVRGQLG